jgi:hypothetical protein
MRTKEITQWLRTKRMTRKKKVSIDDLEKLEEDLSSDEMKDIGGGAKPDDKAGIKGTILWA